MIEQKALWSRLYLNTRYWWLHSKLLILTFPLKLPAIMNGPTVKHCSLIEPCQLNNGRLKAVNFYQNNLCICKSIKTFHCIVYSVTVGIVCVHQVMLLFLICDWACKTSRDQSILLLFSPIFRSGNSFFYLLCSRFCSKFQYFAHS